MEFVLTITLRGIWDPLNKHRKRMKGLKVISDTVATNSRFLKLRNVQFVQNGMKRSWDYIAVSHFVFI